MLQQQQRMMLARPPVPSSAGGTPVPMPTAMPQQGTILLFEHTLFLKEPGESV